MIARYTNKEMGDIWSDYNRYATWLKVELAVCKAWCKLGRITEETFKEIKNKAAFEINRIHEIEKITKHDLIAFLTNLAEFVGPNSRFIHMGLTSSDVLDTTFALQIKDSANLIKKGLDNFLKILKKHAIKHKYTLQIGRTHGIHAEPITFGIKLAGFYAEFIRNRKRIIRSKIAASRGKISGAVGTYSHLSPELEQIVMRELGLIPAIGSTQVVARDGLAEYFCNLAILGGSIERLALEIRHLQRTEVMEVEEAFSEKQKGSSAMPHKRNPISSENLTGQARLLRSYAISALENIALWHERDISHSSVERTIGPDANILAYYSLSRLSEIIDNLIVYPERMIKNLNITEGLIYSQQILLAFIEKGIDRNDAYELIQRNVKLVWEHGGKFKEYLYKDLDIKVRLGTDFQKIIEAAFNPISHLKYVDYIFKQVFNV